VDACVETRALDSEMFRWVDMLAFRQLEPILMIREWVVFLGEGSSLVNRVRCSRWKRLFLCECRSVDFLASGHCS